MEDTLSKRYLIKLLASAVNGFINIIIIAIVPKALGNLAFGHFSYLQQFFSQVIGFLDAGTSTAFFTKLSGNNTRDELILFYATFVFFIVFILYLIISLFEYFNILNFLIPNIEIKYIYLAFLFGVFTWITQVLIKVSDAFALTVSVELMKIIHKILSLFLLIAMLYSLSFDLSVYYYYHLISLMIFIIIIIFLFFKRKIFYKNLFFLKISYINLVKEFYHFSSPLFVFNVVAILISLFNIWLLQSISGSVETGYYGLAYSIAAMCFLFTAAMTQIISREFSKYFMLNDLKKIKYLFKRYIPMLYSISSYFGVFLAFQSETLLNIFTGSQFKDAYWALMVMAFYPIHQTYGQLSGSLFFSTNRTSLYKNIGILSSVVSLLLSIIFIYYFEMGAFGFALMMVISQFISVNIQLFFNTRFLEITFITYIKHQFLSILTFLFVAYISTHIVYINEYTLYSFFIKGMLYTFFVIFIAIIYPSIFSITRKEVFIFIYKCKRFILKKEM